MKPNFCIWKYSTISK